MVTLMVLFSGSGTYYVLGRYRIAVRNIWSDMIDCVKKCVISACITSLSYLWPVCTMIIWLNNDWWDLPYFSKIGTNFVIFLQ